MIEKDETKKKRALRFRTDGKRRKKKKSVR